jgi:DNA (cytosine-5)-methyltransferase 1
MMRYLSVCSGIEAATVAWHSLGWEPTGFAEIDKFPSAVLKHHYPEVPNFGDFTTIKAEDVGAIDLLVGGTPCQSFSVAGLRGGLADDRGNLALEFLRLAQRARPRWLVWENVPGVLSSDGGRDFGAILGGMVECGYGFAYRVLDAQYFGLAQRRKRVFVVGYLGDWRRAAAVLFERESLSWNPPPRSKEGQGTTVCPTLRAGGNSTGGDRPPGTDVDTADSLIVAKALNAKGGMGRIDAESETFVTHSLRAEGFDASEDGTGRGVPLVTSFHENQRGELTVNDTAGSLKVGGGKPGQGYPAIQVTGKFHHADASETRPIEALRALFATVDEETISEWCLGILAAFWPQEVLRSEVHGRRFRCAPQPKRGLVNVSLSRSQVGASWSVQDLWEAGCDGCAPQGWKPSEQLSRELGAYLSRLPYSPSPAQRCLHSMWEASEGSWLLRKALSALEETRRSTVGQGQPAQGSSVRRLTAEECEALQGFPRGYTAIPYRGKVAADGPRYRALGNSMAVPCMAWIGRSIASAQGSIEERLRDTTDHLVRPLPDTNNSSWRAA